MLDAVVFYTLAALILGLGILVITARSAVHSVLFLVMNFLLIAALYVTLNAEFLAVIQIMVYAGGIVVLYLFVVMLVNLKRDPEQHVDSRRLGRVGIALALVVLAELVAIAYAASTRAVVPRSRFHRVFRVEILRNLGGCFTPII
jgi:NADH-quinone oxidoreductase subunit J